MNLFESQRYAQMMFTSCAWFFWDINRPEAIKNLQYAARAIEYLQSADLIERVEAPFLKALDLVHSRELPGITAEHFPARGAVSRR